MAVLTREGDEGVRVPLEYAGTPSRFRGSLPVQSAGLHQVLVYAYHPETGNTGLDRTTFIVRGD